MTRIWTASLVVAAGVALAYCRSGGSGPSHEAARAATAAADTESPLETVPALPPGCVQFLSQLQCWLRARGNAPADVTRAIANARYVMESRSDAAVACERGANLRRREIGSAGCSDLNGDMRDLPASAEIECGPDAHFFVRRDGRVSGCHHDCSSSDDCSAGEECNSIGSAAGGPIDEPFCE